MLFDFAFDTVSGKTIYGIDFIVFRFEKRYIVSMVR